ncbi:MAG: hypothetical protein Q7R63_00525 [bacterium]|nr:hypothetical protein [bacterium]
MTERVHLSSRSASQVTVAGLTGDEPDKLEAAIAFGASWIRTNPDTGRFVSVSTTNLLPDPMNDDDMLPYWEPHPETDGITEMERYNDDFQSQNAGVMIQHLGAYSASKEVWRHEAAKLTSYGFVCMRSPRGADGRYWEGWYLPSLYAAKGDLALALTNVPAEGRLDRVISFLCQHCHVGTIDAITQRAGMGAD